MELRKQIFLAKLTPYKTHLSEAGKKDGFVSITLGQQFNALLAEARELYPAVASHFPPELTVGHGEMYYCETYFQLKIYVDQLLGIIGVEN